MIIHIPHASLNIDQKFSELFTLTKNELAAEKLLMADLYTDDLFAFSSKKTVTIEFKHCRLLVDVERFADDEQEPMSKMGMGVIYSKTAHGNALKRTLNTSERDQLLALYHEHHKLLSYAVTEELNELGSSVIVDEHSFPSSPLPCDQDQGPDRPDFCIGFEGYHSQPALVSKLASVIKEAGYSLGLNTPYAGSLVPMEYYLKEPKVQSVMIEINRCIYMDESTGEKLSDYGMVKELIQKLLKIVGAFQYAQ